MRIFVFIKKQIIIISVIIFLLTIISLIYKTFKISEALAVELTDKSTISEECKQKIEELTKAKEKIAYLTFDDGPNISVTPKVLDILKKEEVKATFFVIGKNVKQYPEIVKREYEEGHYIANHGYNHNNKKLYKNKESFIKEVKETDEEIGKAIEVENYCSHIFRFPNGFMSSQNKSQKKEAVKLLKEMDYTYIDWNCLNNDSIKKYSPKELLNNLKKTSKGKQTLVILMHDTKDVSDSSKVLEETIKYLKNEGYKFENFYNLLENDDR